MARYLITYDLKKNKDYPRLWSALTQLGACRAMLSVWVATSTSTATQVRDHLKQFVDNDDKLLVVGMSGDWGSWNLSEAESSCIKRHAP